MQCVDADLELAPRGRLHPADGRRGESAAGAVGPGAGDNQAGH